MIYVIADTHFYHYKILDYDKIRRKRFSNTHMMNDIIISYWNKEIEEHDWVIHLGDISLGKNKDTENIIKRLHGNKILIKGNHDRNTNSWYLKRGFKHVYKEPVLFKNFIFSHRPINPIDLYKYKLHNIHGHTHSKKSIIRSLTNKYHCACVEKNNFKPIKLSSIIGYYYSLQFKEFLKLNLDLIAFNQFKEKKENL